MKIRASLAFLLLAGFPGAAVSSGQGPTREAISNWPAPAFWEPSSPEAFEISQPRAGVGPAGLLGEAAASPLPFVAMTPCRVVDTRGNGFTGAYGPPALAGNAPARTFNIPAGPCSGIPADAGAYSINVAAILPASDGFMTVFPTGAAQPASSDLNFLGGEVISNAIVAPAGTGGAVSIFVNVSTHVILDINGFYAASGSGNNNTFLGLNAGNFTMTGSFNTGIGQNALSSNITGDDNTAIGLAALVGNTVGGNNTALGTVALLNNSSGDENTATGAFALQQNTTGSGNTATGFFALFLNTGSNNIAIGNQAGSNLTTGSNNICIGNPGVAGELNTIRIGEVGTQTATFIAGISGAGVTGVPVLVSSAGRLGVASSSRFVKENIRDVDAESDGLMSLRPVAFHYKRELDPRGVAQYGLIAEEVAEIYPELVVYDADGRPETIRYQLLDPLLLNEVQKQHRALEAQQAKLRQQSETIDHQEAEIEALKLRLSSVETRLLADMVP